MQQRQRKAALKTSERGLYFALCDEHFPNCTVAEMLERLSSTELMEWIAYLSIKREAEKKARDEAQRHR